MGYNKNGKYTQEQITNLLFAYMVEAKSAAYVCKNILGMTRDEIGDSRFAWRKIQGYYNSYGFRKRYNNGSAFRKITKNKLQAYVSLYWNKRATEKDLIAFFPEIVNDLNEAKIIEGERKNLSENSSRTGSISTGNTGSSSTIYEKCEPKNHTHYHTAQTTSLNHNTTHSYDTDNYYTTKESGSKRTYKINTPWKQTNPVNNRREYDNEINSSEPGNFLGVGIVIIIVIGIIAIIAIAKSGIISTIFNGITNGLKNIFWILELIFFYGGIVLFIVSLFKKTTRRVWTGCIGMSVLGLGFGSFSTGNFLLGIILGIIGIVLILVKR